MDSGIADSNSRSCHALLHSDSEPPNVISMCPSYRVFASTRDHGDHPILQSLPLTCRSKLPGTPGIGWGRTVLLASSSTPSGHIPVADLWGISLEQAAPPTGCEILFFFGQRCAQQRGSRGPAPTTRSRWCMHLIQPFPSSFEHEKGHFLPLFCFVHSDPLPPDHVSFSPGHSFPFTNSQYPPIRAKLHGTCW